MLNQKFGGSHYLPASGNQRSLKPAAREHPQASIELQNVLFIRTGYDTMNSNASVCFPEIATPGRPEQAAHKEAA